jgi:hypothetical protein
MLKRKTTEPAPEVKIGGTFLGPGKPVLVVECPAPKAVARCRNRSRVRPRNQRNRARSSK